MTEAVCWFLVKAVVLTAAVLLAERSPFLRRALGIWRTLVVTAATLLVIEQVRHHIR